MYRILLLAPSPGVKQSELPGHNWDPTKAPPITGDNLKCLGAFIVLCLILWVIARVANGKWSPPSNGGGGNGWS